jgi:hypothetical protein
LLCKNRRSEKLVTPVTITVWRTSIKEATIDNMRVLKEGSAPFVEVRSKNGMMKGIVTMALRYLVIG